MFLSTKVLENVQVFVTNKAVLEQKQREFLKTLILPCLIYLVFALLAWRHLSYMMRDYLPQNVEVGIMVNSFFSSFRNMQSRILMPGVQGLGNKILGSHELTWKIMLFCLLFAVPFVNYLSFRKIYNSNIKGIFAGLLALLMFIIIGEKTIQFWDLYDMCMFSIALYGILSDKPKIIIVAFFLDVLNRESVLFMTTWLLISSLQFAKNSRFKLIGIEKSRFILGFLTFSFGWGLITFIRSFWKHKDPLYHSGKNWLMGNIFTFESLIADLSKVFSDTVVLSCLIFWISFFAMALYLNLKKLLEWKIFLWITSTLVIMNLVAYFVELRTISFMLPAYIYLLLLLIDPKNFRYHN